MMKIATPLIACLLVIGALVATPVLAQSAAVESALESGAVGEQADGYIGFVRPPSADLRREVESINIKRREGYTQVAQARNVSIEAFAASIGCKTLSGLRNGRAYSVGGGVWATKTGAIALPAHCG